MSVRTNLLRIRSRISPRRGRLLIRTAFLCNFTHVRYGSFSSRGPKQAGADGTRFVNYRSIMNEIDQSIETKRSPAVELIVANPAWSFSPLLKFRYAANPYGHLCVRYHAKNLPKLKKTEENIQSDPLDKSPPADSDALNAAMDRTTDPLVSSDVTILERKDIIMNIVGNPKHPTMVNFIDPATYFFASPDISVIQGAEQGGIHERSFISVRVERLDHEGSMDVETERLNRMHAYFRRLRRLTRLKLTGYVMFGPFWDFFRRFLPIKFAVRRNCAGWTTSGLVRAGAAHKKDPSNVSVVFYHSMKPGQEATGPMSPFSKWLIRGLDYMLEKFVNVEVYAEQLSEKERNSVKGSGAKAPNYILRVKRNDAPWQRSIGALQEHFK